MCVCSTTYGIRSRAHDEGQTSSGAPDNAPATTTQPEYITLLHKKFGLAAGEYQVIQMSDSGKYWIVADGSGTKAVELSDEGRSWQRSRAAPTASNLDGTFDGVLDASFDGASNGSFDREFEGVVSVARICEDESSSCTKWRAAGDCRTAIRVIIEVLP